MSQEFVRWVDKIPDSIQREKEMEVLCLGLSRTGTMSLYTALNILGYQCYHYIETANNKPHRHIRCWLDGLNTKLYGTGKPYGRAEFDKILGKYGAVTDAPCTNFAEELLKAYPDAKVVLNTRDVDKWLPSMERSYYDILAWRPLQILSAIETQYIPYHLDLLRLILTDWTSGDWSNRTKLREGFFRHYKHVRSLVPEDNLLEHRPQDGWEPLCKFLGKPVPNEPYPRVNEGDNAFQIHVTFFWEVLSKLSMKYVAPVLVAACALWVFRAWKT